MTELMTDILVFLVIFLFFLSTILVISQILMIDQWYNMNLRYENMTKSYNSLILNTNNYCDIRTRSNSLE